MLFVPEFVAIARTAQAPTIAHAALPIIPILLLPFIVVFFVFVFPIWLVSAGALGLVWLLMRGVASLVHRVKPGSLDATLARLDRAHRWVWTFGGLAEKLKES